MTGSELRKAFIDYFVSKGHQNVRSSALIPRNDPTLLFTNAGMVQFKDVFLGQDKREYTRAATVQKCVRAGGKHNDLENVGRTGRHHTFFEMLGNFSFGDYFKEDAIIYAWEFLTEVVKLPKDRLWISVYKDDDEAFALWRDKVGVPAERIIRLGEKDNFWQMGDTGPCGPCSEIHIDQGAHVGCGKPTCAVGCDCDRHLEIWNLVFMQYDRDAAGNLTPLPKPSIDTGMGLERITAVVNGKTSNYDSDLFQPLLHAAAAMAKTTYGSGEKSDVSLRVIADHIRAITFLITDGVVPSNEGRGYVLRRILRRAARHGKMLGLDRPFLHLLSGEVVKLMREAYPEVIERHGYVAKVVLIEEERFAATLDQGLKLLADAMEKTRVKGTADFPGDEAFRLYDTFGFPLDLMEEIVEEQGFHLDRQGFETAMVEQRERAKAAWAGSGEERVKAVYKQAQEAAGAVRFTGYESVEGQSRVLAIIIGDALSDAATEGQDAELVLDVTPFYGESGGQVGDEGALESEQARLHVKETVKPLPDFIVHRVKVTSGTLKKGDVLEAAVDVERRRATARNHTATHLLQSALRLVLGDHVKQAGSLVEPDRLRFDFTHFSGLNRHELDRIESVVNEQILNNLPVSTAVMAADEAIRSGAMALFGEKYGDTVRVVSVDDFSRELCGGTHCRATGEIGLFKIMSESAVAAGTRRVEAVTGLGAYSAIKGYERELRSAAEVLKSGELQVAERVEKLATQARELEKELEKLNEKMATSAAGEMLAGLREIGGVKALIRKLSGNEAKDLRGLGDKVRDRLGSGVIALGAENDGKASLLVMVTKDLTDRLHAGKIIQEIAPMVGGSGGGKPEMAQAGGKEPAKIGEALDHVANIIARERGNG
ncbi:MAG: alanine--tRNA ligase [Nitrospirota bacterium]|nr:alanine--tRNA ligase [Nitrospirota bacterium]